VIWGACNEDECFVTGNANATGREMAAATKKWDTTRPLSANQYRLPPPSSDPSLHTNDTLNFLSKYLDVEGFSHGGIVTPGAGAVHAAYPGKNYISSECCSCQTQRGEDTFNPITGSSYPHSLEQATCMQHCMTKTYSKYSSAAGSVVGIISGTSGVWTLFDYGGEVRPTTHPAHPYLFPCHHISCTAVFWQFVCIHFCAVQMWQPGPWPLVSSSFGQFDYAGFAKSASYWYRALWLAAVDENEDGRPPLPPTHVVRISQSWHAAPPTPVLPTTCDVKAFLKVCPNGGGQPICLACAHEHSSDVAISRCDGPGAWQTVCGMGASCKPNGVDVQVFSDLLFIELFLNGKSQGTAPCSPGGFASFCLDGYVPGNLTAVGKAQQAGEVLASHTIVTAGPPIAIKLSIDAPSRLTGTGSTLVLDGHDTALIRATLVDSEGRIADASNLIQFEIESGPGFVSGVHNGDAKSHEPQVARSRHAYHGLARATVKVTRDTMSDELLKSGVEVATGDGLRTVALGPYSGPMSIQVTASSPGLAQGRVSIPVSSDPMDAPLEVAGADLQDELIFE
jgi:hypothetical protein